MTLPQMIRERHDRWTHNRCFLVKRGGAYHEVTWSEYYTFATRIARALAGRGIQTGDRVAILSHSRYEWAVADTGILTAGAVCVPLYPSLTRPEVKKLLERSGTRVLFVSDHEQVEKCLPLLDEVEGLELLVVFEPEAIQGIDRPDVVSLEALAARGDDVDGSVVDERLAALKPDDVATIIFTSGTTGEPKGVMLTHRNITANVEASLAEFDIGPNDVHLAHLPLAHILERMAGYYLMLYTGATVGYAESIQTVADNFGEVRPTVAVSVPRIFEKVYAGVQAKAAEAPAPVRMLTFWALKVAREAGEVIARKEPLPLGLKIKHAVADRIVFSKIRHRLGGRMRFFISGGAPLSPELAKAFLAMGIRIYEGYGLTETSPVIAVNTPRRWKIGTVGPVLSNLEVRIADDGEILVKGPSVFPGYFQDEEKTREVFTSDGFFMTGDIGELDREGFLRITDRKKDLIVTAGGKNVAPQKVENILKMSKYISEAMLYGDKKKFISALIVPDFEWLKRYAELKGISYSSLKDLVAHPQVQDFYHRLIQETQQKAQLASYESVKKFVLLDHEFAANQGEVTPTLKMRRKIITEHYRKELEALYEEG
ncbi:MAG: long-chain fatty acid--CoA ligase [Deltaproteobacteria bacterium]|nr:long-chain fatty acid--CoA ligase [Deltaproteobacteria bacterium]